MQVLFNMHIAISIECIIINFIFNRIFVALKSITKLFLIIIKFKNFILNLYNFESLYIYLYLKIIIYIVKYI
jgi:hypothetical protein